MHDRTVRCGPTLLEKLAAGIFASVLMLLGWVKIGWPPVAIVGGSSVAGFFLWLRAYRSGPISPKVILPPFLLTVAGLEAHMIEEYVFHFGPAMSRLFSISWSEFSFLLIFTFVGPILYALTALGLFWRVRLAGFVACFIFIGPGCAEIVHFVFPFIRPSLSPEVSGTISAILNGHQLVNLPNYWLSVTGRYYFPGLFTALLPMIPGIWGVRSIVLRANRSAANSAQATRL